MQIILVIWHVTGSYANKVGPWCFVESAHDYVGVDIEFLKFSIEGREDFTPYWGTQFQEIRHFFKGLQLFWLSLGSTDHVWVKWYERELQSDLTKIKGFLRYFWAFSHQTITTTEADQMVT